MLYEIIVESMSNVESIHIYIYIYIYIYLLESNQSRTKFRYTFSVCRDNNNSIIADRVARKDDDTEFWREF